MSFPQCCEEKCFWNQNKKQTLPGSSGSQRPHSSGERTSGYSCLRASLTVEASLTVPVFMLVMYLFWSFFPILLIQMRLQYAMDEVTGELAQQAYLLEGLSGLPQEEEFASLMEHLTEAAWRSYAGSQVKSKVGESALAAAPIASGLSFAKSSWERQGDMELVVEYKVALPRVLGLSLRLPVCQRSRRKCWTGQNPVTGGGEAGTGEEIVYFTDSGTVYHRSAGCYHLNVSVRTISSGQIAAARSRDGSKYYPCERCAAVASGMTNVYVTPEGNRYHVTRDCAGLKRSVHAAPLSEVAGRRACKDCG